MAKGNLLQGQARGKVGDVVFSRANGEQISRVRNRNPKNPKTAKQMYQRAIMATVMQAYKAGQKIFDHSFQDQPKGAGNQRIFIRENAKLLRKAIADALTAPDMLQTTARTVAPSAVAPVPNAYLISRGTYENTQATVNGAKVVFAGNGILRPWADFYALNDYREGDLFTVVFFESAKTFAYTTLDENNDTDKLRSVYNWNFHFIRLRVKPIPNGSTSPTIFLNAFLEVTGSDLSANWTNVLLQEPLNLNLSRVIPAGNIVGGIGIIRSREDSNLRSTSYMTALPNIFNAYGLAANVVGEIWRKGAQPLGNSDLILEGGDDEQAAPVPAPVPYAHRLMLQDGTITQFMPENPNDVKGIEFTNGKFVVKGNLSVRKPIGGDVVTNSGVYRPEIVSTLEPSPDLPAGAIAVNGYWMPYAISVINEFLAEFGGSTNDWASYLDLSYFAATCENIYAPEKRVKLYNMDTGADNQTTATNYLTLSYVWMVEV